MYRLGRRPSTREGEEGRAAIETRRFRSRPISLSPSTRNTHKICLRLFFLIKNSANYSAITWAGFRVCPQDRRSVTSSHWLTTVGTEAERGKEGPSLHTKLDLGRARVQQNVSPYVFFPHQSNKYIVTFPVLHTSRFIHHISITTF